MQTSVKKTDIRDIIANNADVYVKLTSDNHYVGAYDIQSAKIVSALVDTEGHIEQILLPNGNGEISSGRTIYHKTSQQVYATLRDILNDNPIRPNVNADWLNEKYGLNDYLYFINHKNEIDKIHRKAYVEHINLVSGEITYRYDMDNFFQTIDELKASRPDLFPTMTKVRVTKEYTISIEEDKLEEFESEVSNIDLEALADSKNYSVERID